MKLDFSNVKENFVSNIEYVFTQVEQFCEAALSVVDEEQAAKLGSFGIKLHRSLTTLESELKKEYLKDIKETIRDGRSSANSLYNGIVELTQAVYYAKQAVNQANILLNSKELTARQKRLAKKEIYANLEKVKEHGSEGIKLIIEGVSLAVKTIDKVKNISSNISGLFNAVSSASLSFTAKKATKPKPKASIHKPKPRARPV